MKCGFVLLEILCVVAIVTMALGFAVLQIGDVQVVMQRRQLEMAARRFIMDCRSVQQKNMFATSDDELRITLTDGSGRYTFGKGLSIVEEHNFEDIGCQGVIFKGNAMDSIRFTGSGSVDDEKLILLRHKDNENLKLVLNLQPVTGRIEISE